MIKKIIKWLVILVFIGAGGFAFYRYMLAPLMVKLQGKTVNAGDITRVKKGNIEVIFQASGTVAAKQDEKVTSKPSGLLQAVYVKEGEYVKKGQKLGLIKPGNNEFEDYKPMPITAPVSGYVLKCAEPEDARGKDISERDLSLPRLGTYLRGSYDNADNASCFLRIIKTDMLIIPVYVSESQVIKLRKDMPVKIRISALGNNAPEVDGKITHISSQIEKSGDRWSDAKGFLVLIEFKRESENIFLGVNATVSIVTDKKENVLILPSNALFEKEGKEYAFKYLGNNKTELTEIKTGLSNDRQIEVTQGLAQGDQVLTALPYGETW